MKRFLILSAIILAVPFWNQAQDLADALRYSTFQTQGTARSGAMGNAFGALGGDFTSVGINPAGIGLYRSGEFAITPKSQSTNIESTYWGKQTLDNNYKFMLNNISYISTIPLSAINEAGIVSVNVGIGYNRLKDFNSNSFAQGNGVDGSYMDYFADNANRGIWSDYYEELAWKTDMLLYDENNKEYWHDIMDAGYGQNQRKSVSKTGSIDEYSFTTGVNFNHKFYLGASIGIIDLNYRETSTISENDEKGNIPYFNNYQFNSYLQTYGSGYNVKFGAIFKPVNEVRLGVALHTPTFYRLNDIFETSMSSSITYEDGSENYSEKSPYSEYDYRLQTPMRATFSGAFIIAKRGLVSVDYELVNYGKSKLRNGGDGYAFSDENMEITEAYKTTGNLRVGGELVATDNVSLRAGLELHPSAYNTNAFGAFQPNSDANLMVYSGGLGYRSGSFFADIAYRFSTMESFDLPYPTPVLTSYPVPEFINNKLIKHDILFTLGFKF